MQHLDEGLIQELIDGEIPSHELAPIQGHLAACDSCRARLDTARMAAAEADELLIMLDEVEPASSVGAPTVIPIRKPHWSRNLAWAASLMLAAGLGFASRDVILPPERGTLDAELVTPAVRGTGDTEPATRINLEEERSASPVARPESREPDPASGSASRVPRPEQTEPAAPAQAPARDQALPPVTPSTAALGAAVAAGAEVTRQSSTNLAEAEGARERAAVRREALNPANAFDRSAPAITSQRALSDAAKSMVAAREVDLPTAMRTLGGSIKLIDGMVPTRLDASGDEVLVVYRVSWGEVLLSQQRVGDRLEWHLTGPPGFPADSLAVLRGKVRP